MTSVNVFNRNMVWPQICGGSNPSIGALSVLDAAAEYFGNGFQAREDMTISHVGLHLNAASGSPDADIRIETIDPTTGIATGTLWSANTNIVTGALSSGWTVHALTSPAVVTRGQFFGVRIVHNSGTSIGIAQMQGYTVPGSATGWSFTNTTGSPALGIAGNLAFGLGSSATDFYKLRHALPVNGFAGQNFNNTSGGRRGIKFRLPFDCLVSGMRYVSGQSATGDYNIGIWDAANAEVGNSVTAIDRSQMYGGNATAWEHLFDSLVPLVADTDYYLAVEPASSTNCNMYHATVAAAGLRSGCPGGLNFHLATYTTGGGWADTLTTIPLMDLLIDEITKAPGGGSGGARQKTFRC